MKTADGKECPHLDGLVAEGRVVRLACEECYREDYDCITAADLERLKENGWCEVSEEQTFSESAATYEDNPEETPPGFSLLDWFTHIGTCPECYEIERKRKYANELQRAAARSTATPTVADNSDSRSSGGPSPG